MFVAGNIGLSGYQKSLGFNIYPKSAIGFGWVSRLRFVAVKKTLQQIRRLLPAAI